MFLISQEETAEGSASHEASRPIKAELTLSCWIRNEAIEQVLVPALVLYIQNDLIQFKLAENIKIIMRTLSALNTANVNVNSIVERTLAHTAVSAIESLL